MQNENISILKYGTFFVFIRLNFMYKQSCKYIKFSRCKEKKIMRKVFLTVLICLMVIGVAGCSKADTETSQPEITGTLEEIMEKVYSGVEIQLPQTNITAINDENIEYFLGTADIEYAEAIASEPMMSSIAHSIALVKVDDQADIEDIKSKIKSNVDGRKWICVGVDDDQIIVDNIGNLVILIMDRNSEVLHESFLSLAE